MGINLFFMILKFSMEQISNLKSGSSILKIVKRKPLFSGKHVLNLV